MGDNFNNPADMGVQSEPPNLSENIWGSNDFADDNAQFDGSNVSSEDVGGLGQSLGNEDVTSNGVGQVDSSDIWGQPSSSNGAPSQPSGIPDPWGQPSNSNNMSNQSAMGSDIPDPWGQSSDSNNMSNQSAMGSDIPDPWASGGASVQQSSEGTSSDVWGQSGGVEDPWGQLQNNDSQATDPWAQTQDNSGAYDPWGQQGQQSGAQDAWNQQQNNQLNPQDMNGMPQQGTPQLPPRQFNMSTKKVAVILAGGFILLALIVMFFSKIHVSQKPAPQQAQQSQQTQQPQQSAPQASNTQQSQVDAGAVVLTQVPDSTVMTFGAETLEMNGVVAEKVRYVQGHQLVYCIKINISFAGSSETVNYYCNSAPFGQVSVGDMVVISYNQVDDNYISVISISK